MENETTIKELNAFLKGRYMGIHQYENYLQRLKDPQLKAEFQKMQQQLKKHAELTAERIQNLGGQPVDSPGFTGTIQEWMSEVKGFPETDKALVKTMLKAEEKYAVELSEEIVKGDLDPKSTAMVEQFINEDRLHVRLLESFLGKNNGEMV